MAPASPPSARPPCPLQSRRHLVRVHGNGGDILVAGYDERRWVTDLQIDVVVADDLVREQNAVQSYRHRSWIPMARH